jgi:PIN domain nuclease of toxin-antitoxin system
VNRVLLDTGAFLWFVFDDSRLSPLADRVISDPKVESLLSIVSLWEIAIKTQIGKHTLGTSFTAFIDETILGRKVELLPIEIAHLIAYESLPLHHRDPFDRLLLAQAKSLHVPMVTMDQNFANYDIEILW